MNTFSAGPRVRVSSIECHLGTRFTADTLAALQRRFPQTRFVWLMGADNLAEMERWHRWREIFGLFPIAVFDRPGWRLKALSSKPARAYAGKRLPESQAKMLSLTPPPAWTFLTGPLSRASSTALRAKARPRVEVVAKRAQAPVELPWRKPKNDASAASQAEGASATERVPDAEAAQGS